MPSRAGLEFEHDAVETVDAGEGCDRVHLRAVQPALLIQRRIGPADAKAARRHFEIVGHDDLDAIGIADDRSRALDRLRNRLEADPATGITRQRKAENAEIEIVLQRRGIDDRHQGRGEHLFALMGERRGLAAMVVAGQRDHAAVRRGAGRVRMLERIQRTVDAGALAVPDAEHAIDLGAGKHADLLAAPHRGCRQILVEAGLEFDVMFFKEAFGAPQRVVVHAERRTAITGDEARGVEALRAVAFALQHRQPDQRLRTREENPLRIQTVLVVQPNFHQRHYQLPVTLRSCRLLEPVSFTLECT